MAAYLAYPGTRTDLQMRKLGRESIEIVRDPKDYATLGKLKSFQYVSGIPGIASNPFVDEEARDAYFDYEEVIILDLWVERVKETELKGQVSFECGSWDGPLKSSLVTMWKFMKPSWCTHPNAALILDMTADIALDLDDDASLQVLAVIHHLLAMKIAKKNGKPATESTEGGSPSN